MKVLALKTVNSDMKAYMGFVWPSSGSVECPDWNPVPKCGGGLHGLLWGEGDQRLLNWNWPNDAKWLVLEVESEEIIDFDGKVKFPRCNVIYCGDMKGAAEKILEVRPESCCPGSGRSCCFLDEFGDTYWLKDGKYHRDDGPAIEYADGDKEWHKDGELHRDDGPAVECVDGSKDWFKDGKYHRDDGPAVEYADGSKDWYKDGKRHRDDGPAIECSNGNKYWYKDNKLHRDDGPAIEYANGDKIWFINGKELTEEQFNLRKR